MAEAVYVLCALTSLACAILLTRGYLKTRVRLLLWSSVCFTGLALNNILLFVDLVLVPELDLSLIRQIPAAIGLFALVAALIWERA
jgi:hypothetical protein